MALVDTSPRLLGTTAFRLAAGTVAAFLAAAAVIVVVLSWQTNAMLTSQVLAGLDAEKAEIERGHSDAEALKEAIRSRSRPGGPALYFLADAQGRKQAGNLNRLPPELAGSANGGTFRYEVAAGREHLAVAIPVAAGSGLVLLVGRDIEDQRIISDRIRRSVLLGLGVLSLIALGGGLAAGRMMLQRVESINQTSRSIMTGDLSRRIPLSGSGDEFDDLASHLNAMIERIELLMNSLREVSDNIAHDLKTPLNRLRNRAEAALLDARGADAYREGLERTIDEADDLIKTFNALLLIARLEAGAFDASKESFDVASLVRDAAELYEPVADEADVAFTTQISEVPAIVANRQLVSQAVINLIENALKYGRTSHPAPGAQPASIAVGVAARDGDVEISVADRGPGIAAADRERVLRRFVRLEECRTPPGTGLGLSLVAAVARLHGGRVRLEDNAPGLRVVLVLPVHNALRTR
jgi:signal transduction histidine kinase